MPHPPSPFRMLAEIGLLTLVALAAPVSAAAAAGRTPAVDVGARVARAHLPLLFEPDEGAPHAAARLVARGERYLVTAAPGELTLTLQAAAGVPPRRLRLRFVGADHVAVPTGVAPRASRSHYFIGRDPARWRTDVPHFGAVAYRGIYAGIDAVLYGNERRLEYDLVVAPGADPSAIVLGFAGSDDVAISDGVLVIGTPEGDVMQHRPYVYQEVGGERRTVDGRVVDLGRYDGEARIGFEVAAYDRTCPLVIDPVLSYATYLGGHPDNDGRAIAVDGAGNAYVTGYTQAAAFPTLGGLPVPNDALRGTQDVFVSKLDPIGALVYSTYLGGTGAGASERGNAIAVDAAGNAYVTGETDSADFPLMGPLPAPNNALQGSGDAFVTKLGPDGDALVYSTYLGGSASFDVGRAIAVEGTSAYVTGTTFSDDFPTAGGLLPNELHGSTDAFVAKLATDGASLAYSTYLGGGGVDDAFGLAVRMGEAYLTGETRSMDFPTVGGLAAPNDTLQGFNDAFVARLNAAGDALVYATYLGGGDVDQGNGIAVDGDGDAYVGGTTKSGDFPAVGGLPAPNDGFRGGADGFVARLAAAGNALVYATFLGGSFAGGGEQVNGIAVGGDESAYVTGQTDANDFPVVDGLPLQNRRGSNNAAAIVAKLAPTGAALEYSTYLGGTAADVGRGIALDAMGAAHVVGRTLSSDFPIVNAAQPVRGSGELSGGDAFVAKIAGGAPAPLAYGAGNVFVSAPGFGEVREYEPDGTLVRGLPLPSGAFTGGAGPAGLAFDDAGELYVADTVQQAIFIFDANGAFAGPFVSGVTAGPQSLVFDLAGQLYVGTTGGDSDVRKYGPTGTLLDQYDVFIHDAFNQWIDLAADQQTLLYTSQSVDVTLYDLATDTQLDDLFVGDQATYGVRALPGGGALIANLANVLRVDEDGDVVDTYLPSHADALFAVSRDPDGQTFWAATFGGLAAEGTVLRVDLDSGGILEEFGVVPPLGGIALGGLAVLGELTEARNGAPVATPTGPTPTPSPTPTATPAPEVCDDCVDNDLDGDVDRDDADCPARADGLGMGLDEPKGAGKASVTCAKTLAKAGAKLEAAKLKKLQTCLLAVLACVQQKPGDAACVAKSAAKCAKGLGKLPKDRAKLTAAVTKKCAAPAVDPAEMLGDIGLGYMHQEDACAARGVGSLGSLADVAACVGAEHECRAESLAGRQQPRAAELLTLADVDPGDLPCLGAGTDGGGAAVDAAKAKAAVKCAKTIAKAGAKFVSTKLKLAQKCAGTVYACIQQKPGDPKCLPKAEKTCAKQIAKLTAPGKGAAAKLAATVVKTCAKAPLTLADVLGAGGLGFGAFGGECAALGVPSLVSIASLATCLERHHECRTEQMLESQMPRLEELLAIGGVALP